MSRSTTMLISATGAYGKAVAEHSFAMLLMLQKKLNLYRDEGRLQLLVTLIQSGDISLQRAAALMNMTPEEFQEKSKMIS